MVKNLLRSIVVNVPVRKAYAIWQDFANWPRFMPHVQELRVEGRQMFWKVLRNGRHQRWEAEVVELTAPLRIAWHACDGRHHRSVVTLKPLGETRTEVSLGAEYESPRGQGDDKGERFEQYLGRFKLVAEGHDVLGASLPGPDQAVSMEAIQ
jgi:uncharacterized membrane protein